jgi:OmpA-OmpF porin, OOP family
MKTWMLSGVAALAVLAGAAQVNASSEINDVVHDFQGNVVRNSFDNCVITKWQSGESACDGQMQEINTELLNIYFNFDSATLTAESMDKLDKVADLLVNAKTVNNIDIVGYADFLGNMDYNSALSDRRAQAVRNYLESKGYMNTNNVSVEALGESASVSNCDVQGHEELKDCLWRDRRVEIKLNYAQ